MTKRCFVVIYTVNYSIFWHGPFRAQGTAMNINDYAYEDPASHEKAVDHYLAKLKTFLMSPDHGDGSWPDIQPAALNESQELMLDMLQLKWGHDCDGDRPVRLRLWYRRTHRMVADWAFLEQGSRHDKAPADKEEVRLFGNLRTLSSVIGSAAEELRMVESQLNELHLSKLREAAALEVYLVRYEPNAAWQAGEHRTDQPVSLHLTQEAADSFVAEGFTVTRKSVRKIKPSSRDNPDGNYAAFKKKIEELSGKVLPWFDALGPYLG